jgi:hypothetical protein
VLPGWPALLSVPSTDPSCYRKPNRSPKSDRCCEVTGHYADDHPDICADGNAESGILGTHRQLASDQGSSEDGEQEQQRKYAERARKPGRDRANAV